MLHETLYLSLSAVMAIKVPLRPRGPRGLHSQTCVGSGWPFSTEVGCLQHGRL